MNKQAQKPLESVNTSSNSRKQTSFRDDSFAHTEVKNLKYALEMEK